MQNKTTGLLTTLLIAFLSATAQNKANNGFIIKGHIDGIEDGTKIYLHDIDAQTKIDSAVSMNGNFTLKGNVVQPTGCWVLCKDEYAVIQVENIDMTFTSPLKDMFLYRRVEGGKEQDLYNELTALQHPYDVIAYGAYDSINKQLYTSKEEKSRLGKIVNAYQDTAQAIYVDYGKAHPNSFLGLDILYRNRQKVGKDTIELLLSQMDETLLSTSKAEALKLFAFGALAQKGQKYIDFEAKDIDGKRFQLSSLEGNYILLSFWNAGCGPCRRENKKISNEYERFKNKISIVSFSTDKVESSWLKASKADNILWTNVSDLKGDNGKIKTQYNVQAIPTSFLINREGVIIEKFIGLDEDFLRQLEKLITAK